MRYINNNIRLLAGVGLLSLMLFSCAKFEDFLSKEPSLNAPTVELAVVSIEDSTITVSGTSNMDGYLAIAILYGTDTAVFRRDDILTNNLPDASRIAYNASQVTADEPLQVAFVALSQNTVYKAIAVANNTEGNTSNMAEIEINTDDTYAPDLVGVNPSPSNAPEQALDFTVALDFNEPVVIADVSKIKFGYLSMIDYSTTWVAVTAERASVSGTTITVQQAAAAEYRQYVFLDVDSGAITDVMGNDYPGKESGLDLIESVLYGLYYRTIATQLINSDFAPAFGEVQTDPEFEIVITYETEVRLGADFNSDPLIEGANIIFTYALSNGSFLDYAAPEENITIDGGEVTIVQPYIPSPGDRIYINVAPGAFRDWNGNVNDTIESVVGSEDGWLISKGLTVDVVYGDYLATCVSYFTADIYVFNVTIVEDPAVTDGVIITGLEGSDSLIYGTFDGVWGQITIESGQPLGDLIGDGSMVVFEGGNGDVSIPVVAEVAMNGDITCTWGGLIVGGDWDGYYWDFYIDSFWEKQVLRKTVSKGIQLIKQPQLLRK